MRNLIISLVALLIYTQNTLSQHMNWESLSTEQTHIINLNTGLEYTMNIGLSYGYQLPTKMPIVLNASYSMPLGAVVFDDFKTKLGGQAMVFSIDRIIVTVKANAIFRRYQNDFARFSNFGSEFSAVMGYYKNRWFIAGEFGFDKAVTTHVKHSELARAYNPDIKSGWYIPSGGNFFYGIQSGFSFKTNDITLLAGKFSTEDFRSAPSIPFYAQLGYNQRF